MSWYPQWVYSPWENITRENMKQYDIRRNKAYDEIEAKEKELGRSLTIDERIEIRNKYSL